MIIFERETREFQPIFVTVAGLAPSWDDVFIGLALNGSRPTAWTAVSIKDDEPGFWVDGMAPGLYEVLLRVLTETDEPVRKIGYITIS
jgi:hypothetical protein